MAFAKPCVTDAYPALTLDSDPRKVIITSARSQEKGNTFCRKETTDHSKKQKE